MVLAALEWDLSHTEAQRHREGKTVGREEADAIATGFHTSPLTPQRSDLLKAIFLTQITWRGLWPKPIVLLNYGIRGKRGRAKLRREPFRVIQRLS
jgi:hypothetical protein